MIEKLDHFETNVLAIKVAGRFKEGDAKLCHKFFVEKILEGHKQVNVFVKLDELKAGHLQIQTFIEYLLLNLRCYHQLGNLAIVGHSNLLENLVKTDNLFFCSQNNGYLKCYFDVFQIEEAKAFVNGKNLKKSVPLQENQG